MKYIYTKENGEIVESPLERWSWGVVYKPTDEQIKEAERVTEEMRKELTAGRNKILKTMREEGAPKEMINAVAEEYRHKIMQRCLPKQTELKQFTADGVFHRFAEIDQSRVDIFTMFRTDDPSMLKRIDIEMTEGMQLFHFYRNIGLDYESKENFRKIQIYVFGWKDKEGNKTYHYILPDDRMITSNKDIDVLRYQI